MTIQICLSHFLVSTPTGLAAPRTFQCQSTYLTHCDWLRAWYRTGIETYADLLQRNPSFIQRFVDPGYTCVA